MSANDIKKILKNENLIIGSDRVLKALRNNEMEKIYLASNAPPALADDIKHFAVMTHTDVEMTGVQNDELGVLCKKPFLISCIGLKKTTGEKKKR